MPLAAGKEAFKQIVKAHLLDMSGNENKDMTPEQSIDNFCEMLATATIALIQTGQVLPTVLVSPSGPVTGTGTIL